MATAMSRIERSARGKSKASAIEIFSDSEEEGENLDFGMDEASHDVSVSADATHITGRGETSCEGVGEDTDTDSTEDVLPELAIKGIGCRSGKGKKHFYKAVLIAKLSADKEIVSQLVVYEGCCVELHTGLDFPFLMKVRQLYEENGDFFMNAVYFYRQRGLDSVSDKETKRLAHMLTEKDVMLSERVENSPLNGIGAVRTVHYELPSLMPSPQLVDSEFLCRYLYNYKTEEARPLTRKTLKKMVSSRSVPLSAAAVTAAVAALETTIGAMKSGSEDECESESEDDEEASGRGMSCIFLVSCCFCVYLHVLQTSLPCFVVDCRFKMKSFNLLAVLPLPLYILYSPPSHH